MPTPQDNETQDEFVSRCIPIVLDDETAQDQEQAVAICSSLWERRDKEASMPETEAPELEDDVQSISCHLVGEESTKKLDRLLGIGKRRSDEEDFWPEVDVDTPSEREDVEKAQEDQQSLDDDDREAYVGVSMISHPRAGTGHILDPPLPLSSLVTAYEESNSLHQNVAAMVTNVDGFGFTLEPVIDLKSKEFVATVEDLLEEKSGKEATEEEIETEVKTLKKEAAKERRKLNNFFAFSADESFIELRRNSREDLEVLGNFAWEVLRDDKTRAIRRFHQIPFYTVRITKRDVAIDVKVKRKISPFEYKEEDEKRGFRQFVQVVGNATIWFKEFGDPRPMSKKDGRYYEKEEQIEALAKRDPAEGVASEILHYKIRAIRGAYGLPRWIGNLISVLGSRQSEEVNFFYFRNKAIPPMIIFVENGRLRGDAVEKLGDFFEQVKGDTEKFWKVAILEGESADDARRRGVAWTGQPRFRVEKLSSEQLKDGLFQEYDANNRDKVGESFRMPRLLRGDVRDFNRATAVTAKAFAEEQIFEPERDRFDSWINRVLGPELDMKFWKFKSLAPIVRDPLSLTEMVNKLVRAGIMVPEEGRLIAEDIFNRTFDVIEEDWVKQPLSLTLAALTQRMQASDSAVTPPGDALHTSTKGGDVLGLGDPGDVVDYGKTIARLKEIRRALAEQAMLPDQPGRDPEGD